jgi:regulator of sirC expression with transglutaminase-like and TPR domain
MPERMSTANSLASELVETFREAATSPDPDLATPALLIARLAYPRLDPEAHLADLHDMGEAAAKRLSNEDGPDAPHGPIDSLNRYLFDQEGFTGNSIDYEDPRNSFLNQVLERRTGIPITLAVVYIEVARRAGVRVDGVNFPGHFLLRFPFGPEDDHGDAVFVDPFHRGAVMSDTDCRALLQQQGGGTVGFEPRMLAPATKLQILIRMLSNLKRIYVGMRSFHLGLALTELRLAIEPSALSELRDRGLLAYHLNDFTTALRSLEAYLRFASRGDPAETGQDERAEIWKHVKALRRRVASLN